MHRLGRATLLGVAMSLCVVMAPAVQADTVRVRSEPNGDLGLTASAGALTDKDKDADFNTLTQADRLGLFYAVFNLTAAAQTVHVTVVLDGPGTTRDATLVDEEVLLGPQGSGADDQQALFEFQIKHRDWPAGEYALIVTAAGTEAATAIASFSISY